VLSGDGRRVSNGMKKSKAKKSPHQKHKKPSRETRHKILYKNLDWAAETAAYFGFSPFHFPEILKGDRNKAAAIEKGEPGGGSYNLPFLNLPERIAALRDYLEHKWDKEPQPVLIAYSPPKADSKTFRFGLEIIGSPKSIADATVIKTIYEILKEKKFGPMMVAINSMGDRESFGRFVKEFASHIRKNLENLHPNCRQNLKKDPLCILSCGHEKCLKALAEGPKPISALSEPGRLHFKEVLEYLEMLNIPYKIEDTLIADRSFGCQTVFKIVSEDNNNCRTLAAGARYNILARKIGFKKELPAVGARIEIKNFDSKARPSRKVEKPLICFVQIGLEAKLKSLQVIEMLREAKIPTYQALSRDKLSSQLQIAENLKIPYTIIMGQKEAVENSVIVRSMANHSQETVSLTELPKYLKKILK
jgi:histidyl-tRNA synthetase